MNALNTLGSSAVPRVAIHKSQDGVQTNGFFGSFPAADSVAIGRVRSALLEEETVEVTSRCGQHVITSSDVRTVEVERENISCRELILSAYSDNSSELLRQVLPVFRVNMAPDIKGMRIQTPIWFAPQAYLDDDRRDVAGFIQEVALRGSATAWLGASEFLAVCREIYRGTPFSKVINPLHLLYAKEGAKPWQGEVSHYVLSFAHEASTGAVFPSQGGASLEQVVGAAEQALGYFDVRTVARALVEGGLGASNEWGGEVKRIMELTDSGDRAQGLLALSRRMKGKDHSDLLKAGVLFCAGCDFIDCSKGHLALKAIYIDDAVHAFKQMQVCLNDQKGSVIAQSLREFVRAQWQIVRAGYSCW